MISSDWVQQRCMNCALFAGGKVCLRDYPRTTIRSDCRIRLYRRGPWQDAFVRRNPLLLNLDVLPIESPPDVPWTKDQKRRRIMIYLGAYIKMKEELLKEEAEK